MTRRIRVPWPDPWPFRDRGGKPIRLLAASDEHDPTLDFEVNRAKLGPIDLVIGCGDLSPERLSFLADAFRAPLVYVRGNHDRGGPWPSPPDVPIAAAGIDDRSIPGIRLLALPWPSGDRDGVRRDEAAAWWQVLTKLNARLATRHPRPWLVFSHVPPRGVGDTPTDAYHTGFAAYRFLLDRLAPPLWLHGHTAPAASPSWRVDHRSTIVLNVTGSVLIELDASDG